MILTSPHYFRRWEVCAEFINQHSNNQRSAKEVLAKAKEMQSGNFALSSLKEEVNKLAYENLQRGKRAASSNSHDDF